jgi:hypothetical protein
MLSIEYLVSRVGHLLLLYREMIHFGAEVTNTGLEFLNIYLYLGFPTSELLEN